MKPVGYVKSLYGCLGSCLNDFGVYTVPVYGVRRVWCDKCMCDRLYVLLQFGEYDSNRELIRTYLSWSFDWDEHLVDDPIPSDCVDSWRFAEGMIQPRPWWGIKFPGMDPYKPISHLIKHPFYVDHMCNGVDDCDVSSFLV